ncbi:MAG: hypothetical protein PHN47_07515 [Clostridia bacterium]|jgi:hypothetical protein|nr:hypothetical protein [Clostridia bacterium]
MEINTHLLGYIYENAKMGENAINHVLPAVENMDLRGELYQQREGYRNFALTAAKELAKNQEIPPKPKLRTEAGAYIGIKMNTLKDNSPSHIAEMTINGSTMGIIQITKKIKDFPKSDFKSLDLAKNIITFEQHNIDNLKNYL